MSNKKGYPKQILPHSSYRRKLGLERLLTEYPDLMAVRKVDGKPESYERKGDKGGTFILPEVFTGNMANLSMNLAGGLFDVRPNKHLRYLPVNDEAKKDWDGMEPSEELYAEYNDNECFGLCFLIRTIHRRPFPYFRCFDSQKAFDEYAKKVEVAAQATNRDKDSILVGKFISKLDTVEIKPYIKVHHAPTKVNYWHITLDTRRPTDTSFIKAQEKQTSQDKRMFVALKQDLVQRCKVNARPNYRLKRLDYKKPYTKKDCLADYTMKF